jgi:hypothetical protein
MCSILAASHVAAPCTPHLDLFDIPLHDGIIEEGREYALVLGVLDVEEACAPRPLALLFGQWRQDARLLQRL